MKEYIYYCPGLNKLFVSMTNKLQFSEFVWSKRRLRNPRIIIYDYEYIGEL